MPLWDPTGALPHSHGCRDQGTEQQCQDNRQQHKCFLLTKFLICLRYNDVGVKSPFCPQLMMRIASLLSRARTADAILVFDSVGAKRLPLAGSTVSRTAHGSASQLSQSYATSHSRNLHTQIPTCSVSCGSKGHNRLRASATRFMTF